jgi:heat shock protein HtpX
MSHGLYYVTQFALEIVFMILGSMVVAWFSRWREYRADAGGARLAGRESMIKALEKLRRTFDSVDESTQPAVATLKISGHGRGLLRFFASHPPLEERIARLQQRT